METENRSTRTKSRAELFLELPPEVRRAKLASLSDAAALGLKFDWSFWARPNQMLPSGEAWRYWMLRAGRGFGKTRVGAETVRQWVRKYPIVNLIGPTSFDVREVMIKGPAGILAVCPPGERPDFVGRELRWPNGARSLLFSAEEPERQRGPQCYKIWADDLAAWRFAEATWDMAVFGLRLGESPQAVITTTPKPTNLVRVLSTDASTILTQGTTHDNRSNLADFFFSEIIKKYEGTRLGRQEIYGELLEDNPGALWRQAQIEELRMEKAPDLVRVVVGVDPAGTSTDGSDEWGIVVAGCDGQKPPHFYVLEDASKIYSPDAAARAAIDAYERHDADLIVAETNAGHEMVGALMRLVNPNVPYKAVTASRGKHVRAQPISALYEQRRAHHIGLFAKLEDQMCDWTPEESAKSPDRMDAMVWAMTELSERVPREPLLTFVSPERSVKESERGWSSMKIRRVGR